MLIGLVADTTLFLAKRCWISNFTDHQLTNPLNARKKNIQSYNYKKIMTSSLGSFSSLFWLSLKIAWQHNKQQQNQLRTDDPNSPLGYPSCPRSPVLWWHCNIQAKPVIMAAEIQKGRDFEGQNCWWNNPPTSPRKFGGVGSWKSTFLLGSVSLFSGY